MAAIMHNFNVRALPHRAGEWNTFLNFTPTARVSCHCPVLAMIAG